MAADACVTTWHHKLAARALEIVGVGDTHCLLNEPSLILCDDPYQFSMRCKPSNLRTKALLLGARTLGAPGLSTRSKDATRGSWHRY